MTKLFIYGAGGFGMEVLWLSEICNAASPQLELVGFIDDSPSIESHNPTGEKILSLSEAWAQIPDARIVCAVGHPTTRAQLVEKAARVGWQFTSILHPRIEVSRSSSISEGSILCAGVAITTDVEIGRHVQINLNTTVGHNVSVGDCTTIGPGVNIGGRVEIGKRVFIGAGAIITNGSETHSIVIGDDAYIGAGSCVLRSVAPGMTVFGVPARPVPLEEGYHSSV